MNLALNNGKAFIGGKLLDASILIEKGKIVQVSGHAIKAEREIDCTGKIVLPGAIDAHVHFRVPGFEYKEDWVSGSLAALHGGVTTVMDMPNTKPPTLTFSGLEEKRKIIAQNAAVNFDLYMGYNGTNLEEIKKAVGIRAVKVYFGSSTGSEAFSDLAGVKKLFELAKQSNFVVAVHAEDENIIGDNAEKYRGSKEPAVHSKIRNDVAEAKAVKALLEVQEKVGNRLHISHLSSGKGLQLVKRAKKGRFGKSISCEVTPHHLFLDSGDYKKLGNLIKCNPSIKALADRKALWKGLKSGLIDVVASDHAPHALEEKKRSYWECPSGIPGVETMLPLLLDAVLNKKIELRNVVSACCENPAILFGWGEKGFIREGFDADLVIVDPKRNLVIENEKLFTKAGYSPFNKRKLKGFVEKTIVGGTMFG